MGRIEPAVTPFVVTIQVFAYALTAFAFASHYFRNRAYSSLILYATFASTSILCLFNLLTFPGAFTQPILPGTTDQTAAWFLFEYHATLAVGLGLYGAVVAIWPPAKARSGLVYQAFFVMSAVAGLSVIIGIILATEFSQYLPAIVSGTTYTSAATLIVAPAMILLTLLALISVGFGTLLRGPWDVAIAFALYATCMGLAVSTIGHGRYSFGWYASRADQVVASLSVLTAFIAEMTDSVVRTDLAAWALRSLTGTGLDPQAVMDAVADRALTLVAAESAYIAIRRGDQLEVRAVSGSAGIPIGTNVSIEQSLSGEAYRTNETKVTPDAQSDSRTFQQLAKQGHIRSLVIAPLRSRAGVIGTMAVASSKINMFGAADVAAVTQMASVVATSVDNAIAYQEASKASNTDVLTGLGNRRWFDDRLEHHVTVARFSAKQLALVIADIDRFKATNDRYGHPVGDEVLKGVAAALQSSARSNDELFRLGGDEFAVIMPSTSRTGAEALRLRAQRRVEQLSLACGPVRVSIGLAMLDEKGALALYTAADRSMYDAKLHESA
jgi:diguanylate cyclase (GGDEF)-like protein